MTAKLPTKLDEALALLREGRWVKRTMDDGLGHYCSLGALGYVWETDPQTDPHRHLIPSTDIRALAKVIREQFPQYGEKGRMANRETIMLFNDHLDTSFSDVEMVFEKAYINRAGEL